MTSPSPDKAHYPQSPNADYEGTVPFDYGDGVDRPNYAPNADKRSPGSTPGGVGAAPKGSVVQSEGVGFPQAHIEPRCPMSISGMCLQMVEGFAPCDDMSECEYAPNPPFPPGDWCSSCGAAWGDGHVCP